jgi:hypothetical protein
MLMLYMNLDSTKTIIIALAVTLAVSHPSIASPSCEKTLYACSTSNNVRIRDAETFKILGKLNRGKCMETKCAYTINVVRNNVLYYRTINSQSRRESLVPVRYIKLVEQ